MEYLLYRILNRKIFIKIDGLDYVVISPTATLRYDAECYKNSLIDDYKYELDWWEDYQKWLIGMRLLDSDYDKKIEQMNNTIRQLKKELYMSRFRLDEQKKIRKNLSLMKNKLSQYYSYIDYYKQYTLDFFAESIKNKYILLYTVYHNNNLVFDIQSINSSLLSKIISALNGIDISVNEFRKLARSELWRSYWSYKDNVFGIPPTDLSEEQKILCGFSRMYDSIFEHPECPDENILEDDDMVDGFLIYQKDKHQDENKKQQVSKLPDKYQEIYLPATSQDEAEHIYNLNTTDGKRILRERSQVLKNMPEARVLDFPDERLDFIKTRAEQESLAMKRR